ncbi:hypothetical protein DI09_145p20 [Mitosporidium daphniae]|uniref:CHCH domain-containing protein n=1 Tax=Mitosporidium daphniae TaxID=1485682 RepID=A0A098VUM0_9MICR|nr:uncharacterized protein DI09_145p20 [Mitosporidium daphniae]KGG52672.1 hypothetical protein DI09_145p20 [Mitosporidium daphniae]|eukprot:XP_013239108.1 uncharacterized protein DI09_145p20 [Mitosporidium daphniae]
MEDHIPNQACPLTPIGADVHARQPRIGVRDHSQSEDDPYEAALDKTGCNELNEALLECYYDHKDWRKCQPEVLAFKTCFEAYQRNANRNSEFTG